MRTPEEAEKRPMLPTLTKMLRDGLNMEPECDADAQAIEDNLSLIKSIFKEWLRTVSLPQPPDPWKGVESTRRLLITLVDEP